MLLLMFHWSEPAAICCLANWNLVATSFFFVTLISAQRRLRLRPRLLFMTSMRCQNLSFSQFINSSHISLNCHHDYIPIIALGRCCFAEQPVSVTFRRLLEARLRYLGSYLPQKKPRLSFTPTNCKRSPWHQHDSTWAFSPLTFLPLWLNLK